MTGPGQRAQRPERVPAARLVRSLGQVEIEHIGVRVRAPAPVAAPVFLDQLDRLGDPSSGSTPALRR